MIRKLPSIILIVLFCLLPLAANALEIKAKPGDTIVASAEKVESLPIKVVGNKIDWIKLWRGGPESYTPADREFLQEIYQGAQAAGLRLAGKSGIRRLGEAESGFGHTGTIVVRVGENGKILPGRGASDKVATSILQIDVAPDYLTDGNGDTHLVWVAYAKQYDTRTSKLISSTKSGPSNSAWNAKVANRPSVEYLKDPEFQNWLISNMADSPENAVHQALKPIVTGTDMLTQGQLPQ